MENSPDPLIASFAKILRTRRRQAGLTQEELAFRAGLSMRYVSLLESTRHQPSLGTMKALADALGVRLSELVEEAEISLIAPTPR